MRAAAPALLPVFRSLLQGELLALVLGDPQRQWTIDELAARTGQPYQTVATEVRRLLDAGLFVATTIGRTKLVTAHGSNPYIPPLRQLVTMAFGPPSVIAEEFATVAGIEAVHIYGSWAARYHGEPGPPPNDIDVLVIGRPDRDDVHEAARRAEHRLGREVTVTHRTHAQWRAAADGFTQSVRSGPLVEVPYRPLDAAVEQGQ